MPDFTQRLKLALGDIARRSALRVVAGVFFTIGAGFLLAALWVWLAYGLGWGAVRASLAIGTGFIVIGLILLLLTRPRHRMPDAEDLRQEVQARVSLAADAAVARARSEATRMAGMAESKVYSVIGKAAFKANKFAGDTARKAGLTPENAEAVKQTAGQASEKVRDAANSNAGSMAKLLLAFAAGVTLAAKLRENRQNDDQA